MTSQASPDNFTLICNNDGNGHGLAVGQGIRINGQSREITEVPDFETIKVGVELRPVGQGVDFIGADVRVIAALNPDHLDYQWMTSKSLTLPQTANDWDNDELTRPQYWGQYLTVAAQIVPEKIIVGEGVWGNADPDRPKNVTTRETHELVWMRVKITFRNNRRA